MNVLITFLFTSLMTVNCQRSDHNTDREKGGVGYGGGYAPQRYSTFSYPGNGIPYPAGANYPGSSSSSASSGVPSEPPGSPGAPLNGPSGGLPPQSGWPQAGPPGGPSGGPPAYQPPSQAYPGYQGGPSFGNYGFGSNTYGNSQSNGNAGGGGFGPGPGLPGPPPPYGAPPGQSYGGPPGYGGAGFGPGPYPNTNYNYGGIKNTYGNENPNWWSRGTGYGRNPYPEVKDRLILQYLEKIGMSDHPLKSGKRPCLSKSQARALEKYSDAVDWVLSFAMLRNLFNAERQTTTVAPPKTVTPHTSPTVLYMAPRFTQPKPSRHFQEKSLIRYTQERTLAPKNRQQRNLQDYTSPLRLKYSFFDYSPMNGLLDAATIKLTSPSYKPNYRPPYRVGPPERPSNVIPPNNPYRSGIRPGSGPNFNQYQPNINRHGQGNYFGGFGDGYNDNFRSLARKVGEAAKKKG